MLDIGWTEILVISVVVLFVVGPRDIPKVLRTAGQWAGKVRALAREFRDSVDDAVREAELDEVRKTVESARSGFRNEIRSTIDPGGELTRSLQDVPAPSDRGDSGAGAPKEAPAAAPDDPVRASPGPPPRSRPPTVPDGAPVAAPAPPAPTGERGSADRPVGLRHVGAVPSEPKPDEA